MQCVRGNFFFFNFVEVVPIAISNAILLDSFPSYQLIKKKLHVHFNNMTRCLN